MTYIHRWLWKVVNLTLAEVDDWLDNQSWDSQGRHELSTSRGKCEAYAISVYLVTMTITTVL